ncbi:MAG: 4-hydroxybenzoate octaprenyltransferase [Pseudomonadales bacterium]|nr:4-hydroxybenzoate octaprenyltransferase [Pseudomonadales bacterium]
MTLAKILGAGWQQCRQFPEKLRSTLARRFPVAYARFPAFWQLARMDRPIGMYLLLWPTLWSLWIAAQGLPDLKLLLIFILGTTAMRAAGCSINDYADRNFDGHVQRTRNRPIVTGRVSPGEALKLCAALCLVSFVLVLFTNRLTIYMAFGGLGIALVYPFMKRFTHLAQLFLAAAFSWGGLMAFTAQTATLPVHAWLLYVANVIWTVVYDTEYAMVDREDDIKLGLRSTAILFAEADRFIIGVLQAFFLVTLSLSAKHFGLGLWFQSGLLISAGFFVYQQRLMKTRATAQYFQAFLNNNRVGMTIFVFTVLDLFFRGIADQAPIPA